MWDGTLTLEDSLPPPAWDAAALAPGPLQGTAAVQAAAPQACTLTETLPALRWAAGALTLDPLAAQGPDIQQEGENMSMEGTTPHRTDRRAHRQDRSARNTKNRVTGAVQEIFTPLGLYTSAEMLQPQDGRGRQQPALPTPFGGLLLLDTRRWQQRGRAADPARRADHRNGGARARPTTAKTASAAATTPPKAAFDAETGVATFVYDFSTQQGQRLRLPRSA